MVKQTKKKDDMHDEYRNQIIDVLRNYSSALYSIDKKLDKENENRRTKFRKYVLPYFVFFSLFLSGLSFFWSVRIYNLGEQYKNSLNPISSKIDFISKMKISNSIEDEYFPLEIYDRYPITYDENNGEITEKYLFKYNVDNEGIESVKLSSSQFDEKISGINQSNNSKIRDLKAFILTKNDAGNFSYIKDPTENKEYWSEKDEILSIFDPAFLPPSKSYTGIYCLALIGKNNQAYLTTLVTHWSTNITGKDVLYSFEGIDIFDEYRWLEIAENDATVAESKELAQKTYEKSLQFLKMMR